MSELVIEHVTVRFGEHVALDDVQLVVGDGEILCVLGPSGSGKSTLLRAIAGLEPLATGRIVRDGTDLAGVAPERRGLGLMFQDPTLFPHRDVLANASFGPRMKGASPAAAEARARELLGLVGLAGYDHRRVNELSGGEQQRVALARALAPAPALLMLDEPLGALDRRLRERLVDDIGALFRRLRQSVLFVTHDHDEAFGLADRVAILHAGRLEQVGSPTELWERPATAFVASFLGWNIVELGAAERVAIRPDALHLDPRDGTLAGVVVTRTFRRDHWSVRVELDRVPGGDTPGSRVDVLVRDATPPVPGERVRLRIEAGGTVSV
jgi:thiamine transport system ATP-binding protein